jgi:hypothetical protein
MNLRPSIGEAGWNFTTRSGKPTSISFASVRNLSQNLVIVQ